MTSHHATRLDASQTGDQPARPGHGELSLVEWTPADADEMGAYWGRNRDDLTPTQPLRPAAWWCPEGQSRRIAALAADVAAGRTRPYLIREDGRMAGEIILSDISHGAFCSSSVGYSVDAARRRRGIASWAVGAVVEIAFGELGLHRVQAATLLDNAASQAVLRGCSFERIGVARGYLAIAGQWRDHILWQRIR